MNQNLENLDMNEAVALYRLNEKGPAVQSPQIASLFEAYLIKNERILKFMKDRVKKPDQFD